MSFVNLINKYKSPLILILSIIILIVILVLAFTNNKDNLTTDIIFEIPVKEELEEVPTKQEQIIEDVPIKQEPNKEEDVINKELDNKELDKKEIPEQNLNNSNPITHILNTYGNVRSPEITLTIYDANNIK